MDSPQRRSKPNNGITYVYLDEVENKRHNSEMEESDKEEIKIDLLYHVDKDIRYSPQLMEQVLLKVFHTFFMLINKVYMYWYRQGLFGIFLTDIIRIMYE